MCCCEHALPLLQAFKRKNEAYKLIWPGKAEFVRMAAKFGATIVPFAAIGCDEAITTWLSGEELEQIQANLPKLPFSLPIKLPVQQSDNERERRPRNLPRARKGVNATIEDVEAFQSVSLFVPCELYTPSCQPLPLRVYRHHQAPAVLGLP